MYDFIKKDCGFTKKTPVKHRIHIVPCDEGDDNHIKFWCSYCDQEWTFEKTFLTRLINEGLRQRYNRSTFQDKLYMFAMFPDNPTPDMFRIPNTKPTIDLSGDYRGRARS